MNDSTQMKRPGTLVFPTRLRSTVVAALCSIAVLGCQSGQPTGLSGDNRTARQQHISEKRVIAVRCLYDQRPWLNLDEAGDRNPEGIRFRVFLDTGDGVGVHRQGTFHIHMYSVRRTSPDQIERVLVSDWHYDTSDVHRIAKPGMLGDGYFLYLAWADKDIPGSEVEIIIKFEDRYDRVARSGTRRLRVPKYGL